MAQVVQSRAPTLSSSAWPRGSPFLPLSLSLSFYLRSIILVRKNETCFFTRSLFRRHNGKCHRGVAQRGNWVAAPFTQRPMHRGFFCAALATAAAAAALPQSRRCCSVIHKGHIKQCIPLINYLHLLFFCACAERLFHLIAVCTAS